MQDVVKPDTLFKISVFETDINSLDFFLRIDTRPLEIVPYKPSLRLL